MNLHLKMLCFWIKKSCLIVFKMNIVKQYIFKRKTQWLFP